MGITIVNENQKARYCRVKEAGAESGYWVLVEKNTDDDDMTEAVEFEAWEFNGSTSVTLNSTVLAVEGGGPGKWVFFRVRYEEFVTDDETNFRYIDENDSAISHDYFYLKDKTNERRWSVIKSNHTYGSGRLIDRLVFDLPWSSSVFDFSDQLGMGAPGFVATVSDLNVYIYAYAITSVLPANMDDVSWDDFVGGAAIYTYDGTPVLLHEAKLQMDFDLSANGPDPGAVVANIGDNATWHKIRLTAGPADLAGFNGLANIYGFLLVPQCGAEVDDFEWVGSVPPGGMCYVIRS